MKDPILGFADNILEAAEDLRRTRAALKNLLGTLRYVPGCFVQVADQEACVMAIEEARKVVGECASPR